MFSSGGRLAGSCCSVCKAIFSSRRGTQSYSASAKHKTTRSHAVTSRTLALSQKRGSKNNSLWLRRSSWSAACCNL
jgi:hypothetical protein